MLHAMSRLEHRWYPFLFLLFVPVLDTLLDVFHPSIHVSIFVSFGDHTFLVISYHRLNSLYPFASLGIGKIDHLSALAREQVPSLYIHLTPQGQGGQMIYLSDAEA